MLQCCAVGTEHFDQDVLKSADEADAAAGTSPDITKPASEPASEPASGTASPSVRRSPPLFPPGSRFDQTTEEQAAKMRLGFSNWFFCSSIEDVKRGNVFEWSAWALLVIRRTLTKGPATPLTSNRPSFASTG
ncbi:unnamed protein product [Tilletia caries]|nr:unnamed protein product [Tilletia caries]